MMPKHIQMDFLQIRGYIGEKVTFSIWSILLLLFFLISKLNNILIKQGQAPGYTGCIQRKESKNGTGANTNHPKKLRA